MQKDRDYFYRKAKRTKKNEDLLVARNHRNAVTIAIRNAKAEYIKDELHRNKSHVLFATITGMDLSVYPYVQDHDPVHRLIINDTIRIINKELNNINERNWVPTCWMASHVHRTRRRGMTKNYYRQLSDGLHPSGFLLEQWAQDIVRTAYLVS